MTWRDRIQANIVRGLPAAKVEYCFLRFATADRLKTFVHDALPYVHDARWQQQRFGHGQAPAGLGPNDRRQMAEPVLNLAFTRAGIELVVGGGLPPLRRRPDATGSSVSRTRLPRTSDAFALRDPIPGRLQQLATVVAGQQLSLENSMFRRLDLLGEIPPEDQPCTWHQPWLTEPIHVLVWASGPRGRRPAGRGGERPGPTTA